MQLNENQHLVILTTDEIRRIQAALQMHREFCDNRANQLESFIEESNWRGKARANSQISGTLFAQTKIHEPDYHGTTSTLNLTNHADIREQIAHASAILKAESNEHLYCPECGAGPGPWELLDHLDTCHAMIGKNKE